MKTVSNNGVSSVADVISAEQQEKINSLINECIPDASQRVIFQRMTKVIWSRAYACGYAKGLETIDPNRAIVQPEPLLKQLAERASVARDGALMRDAVQVISALMHTMTPQQVVAVGRSLSSEKVDEQRRSPMLRIAAANGRLVLQEEESAGA